MRMVPIPFVPFRMIRAKHFVLRTRPALASLNPIIRAERDRRNLVGSRLRFEIRVLLFDLRDLLFYLLHFLLLNMCRRPARRRYIGIGAGCSGCGN